MGIYLLRCDEQRFQEIFNDWLGEPGINNGTAIHTTIKWSLTPLQARDEQKSLLSLRFDPDKDVRLAYTWALVIGIAASEALTLLLLHFHSSPPSVNPLLLIFFLLWIIAILSPTLIIGGLESTCDVNELLLRRFFTEHGVTSHMLILPRNRMWFRGDNVFIFAIVVVIVLAQVFTGFGFWGLVPVVSPLLFLVGVLFIIIFFQYFMYDLVNDTTQFHHFWKIEVARLAGRVGIIFLFPIVLFAAFYILGNLGVAVTVISPHMPIQTFMLELFSFNAPAYLNNPFIQQIGYTKWIAQTAYMLSPDYTFHIVVYGGYVILTVAIIAQFTLLKVVTILKTTAWEELELLPGLLPIDMVQGTSSPLLNSAILLNGTLIGMINVISVGIAVLGLLVTWNVSPSWVPLTLKFPFHWYQAMFESTFGSGAGDILARLLLIVFLSPLLLWLLFWGNFLRGSLWKSYTDFFPHSQRKSKQTVQATLNDLCKQQHIPSPKVAIESGSLAWPTTVPILPFTRFCVIRISDALVEKLTPAQLRLVLAHELGHTKKHVRKLWLTQLYSCLSLISPGYFTILLNYWSIEMEADDFATQITERPQELISLLEKLETMTAGAEAEAEKERWEKLWLQSDAEARRGGRRADQETSSPKQQLAMVYKTFFGDAIWGAAHPPNKVRIARLGHHTDVVARSEGEERVQDPPHGEDNPIQESRQFDMLTERASIALSLAREEAQRLQHNYIGTEHLLLGLVGEGEGIAAKVLNNLGVELIQVRSAIEFIIGHGDHIVLGEIGLTPRAKKVIELAVDEARRLNHHYIGTEHILLGLVREGEGIAAGVLETFGIELEQVRTQMLQMLGQVNEDSGEVLELFSHDSKDSAQEAHADSEDSIQESTSTINEDILYHPEAARSVPPTLINYVKQELFQIQKEVAKFTKISYVRELILGNDPRLRLTKYQQIQEELVHEQYDGLAAELCSECLQYEDNLMKLRQKIQPRDEMAGDARYFALKDDILACQSMLAQAGNALDQQSKAWIANKIGASKQAQIATERGHIMHQITRTQERINQLKSLQQLLPLTLAQQMPTAIEKDSEIAIDGNK